MSLPLWQPADHADRERIARIVARESAETLVAVPHGIRVAILSRLLRPAARPASARFVSYDRALGDLGASAGSSWIVQRAVDALDVRGDELVPRSGPLLVVANHPGQADAVALLAAMRRDDAWIVTAEFAFLRALRHASRRFLFVPERAESRRSVVRDVVARLRDGEAVLLFPAGGLEPDPDLAPAEASGSFARWSRSIGLLARRARGTRVVPALVRGAVSRAAFDHPLARRRTPVTERQRMAALLQLALRRYQRVRLTVRFGPPIEARPGTDMQQAVLARMRLLLADH
ncbi:MAG TPA: lysophospholipid acyltransferase family protein [Candidatus Limnocylindria bacterium]|nr:lysophospholipid acyltransferase family protein [Candidatus Limnocylindria bacterium]